MPTISLLLHLDGFVIEDVITSLRRIIVVISAEGCSAACPRCTHISDRVHSRYFRRLHDLPCADVAVVLRIRVRRFRCTNSDCTRAIFAERFPTLAGVRARRTHRQKIALEHVGFALGGSAGARLADRVGLSGSRSTIIRFVCTAPLPQLEVAKIIGVDDWARRKGQRYGTILVDLERHHPIDILPDRTAEVLAAWLREHPGVEIISRDRAGSYAEGARQGAPNAVQVADRFHLLVNVGEVVERVLSRKHAILKEAATAVDNLSREASATKSVLSNMSVVSPSVTKQEQIREARRARRLERFEAVIDLYKQGASIRAISRQLSIARATVRRFLKAETFPEQCDRPKRPTIMSAYEAYLRERWAAGCHRAHALWREIHDQGFRGSESLVRRFIARWRLTPGRRGRTPRHLINQHTEPTPPAPRPTRVPSTRQARWLLLRDADDLEIDDLAYREQVLQMSDDIRTAVHLANDFGRIVRERDHPALDRWLQAAKESGMPEFHGFVVVLHRDLKAVRAALTYNWSNGQTEGQINRLKFLKRQMFGRASLDLLKRRFLMTA